MAEALLQTGLQGIVMRGPVPIPLVHCRDVGGHGIEWQPRAYTGQLTLARTLKPLLRDPLAKDTGLWPVTADGSRAFAGGAYTLSSNDAQDEVAV